MVVAGLFVEADALRPLRQALADALDHTPDGADRDLLASLLAQTDGHLRGDCRGILVTGDSWPGPPLNLPPR